MVENSGWLAAITVLNIRGGIPSCFWRFKYKPGQYHSFVLLEEEWGGEESTKVLKWVAILKCSNQTYTTWIHTILRLCISLKPKSRRRSFKKKKYAEQPINFMGHLTFGCLKKSMKPSGTKQLVSYSPPLGKTVLGMNCQMLQTHPILNLDSIYSPP